MHSQLERHMASFWYISFLYLITRHPNRTLARDHDGTTSFLTNFLWPSPSSTLRAWILTSTWQEHVLLSNTLQMQQFFVIFGIAASSCKLSPTKTTLLDDSS